MIISRHTLFSLALIGLAGCTSGQIGVEPASTATNLNQNRMEFAVGIATYVNPTTMATVAALNVVPSFRQPNGLSATLVNTPLLTGPFVVPAAATNAGDDAGTNRISGSPQVTPAQTAIVSTFGVTGGIFSYGSAPANNSATGTPSGAASYALYAYPRYAAATGDLTQITYRGGPPAYPRTTDGTYPPGFSGYSQGFATFELTPVPGTYNLSAGIQDSSGNTTTIAAPPTTLTSTTGLPVFAAPAASAFVRDGSGGGSVAFTAPAGVTETLADIADSRTVNGTTTIIYYTVVVQGSGPRTAVFPPTLGPGATASTSFLAGDKLAIYLIGADYPAFEAGPPLNTAQLPTLLGTTGQADLTFAPTLSITY